MRATSIPRALLPALCLAFLGTGGCDDKKENEKEKESKTAKSEGKDGGDTKDAKSEGGGGGDEAKTPSKKDDEIAALKAELEAAKEAKAAANELDPEAAKELDEPPTPEDEVAHEKKLEEGKKGPVSVANVSFSDKTGFGDRGIYFELSAELTVNEKKDGGVYAKASCVMGDEVYVNVGTVGSQHSELGKMNKDETKRLTTGMFRSGLKEKPARCQIAFDYGARDFSTRLADFCWNGSKVEDGACKEKVEPKAKGDGDVVPFGFKVKSRKATIQASTPDASTLDVAFSARFNKHLEKAPHLYLKTACKLGEKIWVEVNPDFPHVKPFSLENGEAIMIHHNVFLMNAVPAKPEGCSFDVLLSTGAGGGTEKINSVCWDGSNVADGACAWQKAKGAPAKMDADSIGIDDITFWWGNDWKDKSKVVLNMRLAATIAKPVTEHVGMIGTAKCGSSQDKEHRIGPDLRFMGSGETVAVRMAAFRNTPLAKPDGKCEITFSGGSWSGEKVEIQKFCLRGTKVNAGKCKGKGKPPAVGTEVQFVNDKKGK